MTYARDTKTQEIFSKYNSSSIHTSNAVAKLFSSMKLFASGYRKVVIKFRATFELNLMKPPNARRKEKYAYKKSLIYSRYYSCIAEFERQECIKQLLCSLKLHKYFAIADNYFAP